jgi:hypothetical protein
MSTLLEPNRVAPSWNLTGPVGVAVAALSMVAVNVTDCPTPEGLADETSVVVVDARVIDCAIAAEVLPANVVFAA